MTNTGNTYRRVRALVMKTTFNGCTVGEAISAANLASKIITDQKLDPARIDWPSTPAGYGWEGEPGRGGKMVEQPKAEKPKRNAKSASETMSTRKRKPAEPKAPRKTNGERLAEMAARPEGFTIEEVIETFGILPHTARALISIELRKKRGINIVGKKGRYTVAPVA